MAIILFLTCLFFTVFMAGVSWFLQISHFPLFEMVGQNHFHDYHRSYSKRLPLSILIPSALATLCAFLLIFINPWGINVLLIYINLTMVIIVQISTFLAIMPVHNVLSSHGYSDKAIRRLTRLQWMRTIAWTVSSMILITIVFNILTKYVS